LNVVVIVNQSSRNSVQLGNYYCERRQVPPQNVLRINWSAANTMIWTLSDFTTNLFNPLLAMLAGRQLTNQIDYVVLSMDIPYQVTSPESVAVNSTTSALFYGFKPDTNEATCSLASGSANRYAGSEDVFRATPPIDAASNSFLVTMITSSNLAMAMQIVDQGAGSDGTFPTQTVYLVKSADWNRNVRYWTFDNAIFDTRLRGNYSMVRTNDFSIWGYGDILGAQTGAYDYTVAGVSFAPGGIADNLTSHGGYLFSSDQLDILSLLAAGAAGSYGTVSEPCNDLAKFPSPLDYFCQARGFSLAECYYQSLTNPYQGLIVGEPLAAPFALPAEGAWNNLPTNALLTGTSNLALRFDASDAGGRPLQQVDLFVDGVFLQTLTNIPPSPKNVLAATINGRPFNYTVPTHATLDSLAAGLARVLNTGTNRTGVAAYAHGDRIELRSTDLLRTASQIGLAASSTAGDADALTTFLTPDHAGFLDSVACGIQSFSVTNNPNAGDYLQLALTKTNGALVSVAFTNTASGTLSNMLQNLVDLINTNAALQGGDGAVAEDFYGGDTAGNPPQFNLLARSPGWNAAQLQARLSGSSTFAFSPSGTQKLDSNLPDLQPRAHLYVTAGATSLPLTFTLDTTALADGFHELTAVAYEGSNVRTQTRVAQTVRIQNTPLSAVFTLLSFDATNIAVEAVLPFSVVANSGAVATIELFSTGGSLGMVPGQSSANFSVSGTNLDVGLHPFYALVTASDGDQYRTETKWIRLLGPDAPFTISLTTPPPRLAWPATAGRSYDILSASDPASPFQLEATVTPAGTFGLWTDTNGIGTQQFYSVRTSQ
jgi:uncharacterized protein (TIGR03790 family)